MFIMRILLILTFSILFISNCSEKISYSGKIIDTKHVENNIKARPDIILMHGDKDEVVPVSFLLEAIELFNRINYKIETKIFENCEHRIPQEGSSLGLEFIKKKLY